MTPDPEPAAGVPGLAAIVLAGGRGSRLGGTDKPGLVVGASTLLAAVISAAIEAGASHVVVVGPARPGTGSRPGGGCRIDLVSEDPPGSGPVAGLRCGIAGVRAPSVAVLAADMPFLRAPHLLALLAAAGQQPAAAAGRSGCTPPAQDGTGQPQLGAILIDDSGHPQWLAGCWPTAALRGRLDGYAGSSLHGLLDPLRPVRLRYPAGPGEPPPWLDCDTASDLSLARAWARRLP